MSKYYITNENWTVPGLAHEIADGKINDTPDGHVYLNIGPIYGGGHAPGNMGVWIATSADPVLIATCDYNGELLWDASDEPWFIDALGYFGFDSDDLKNAVESFCE